MHRSSYLAHTSLLVIAISILLLAIQSSASSVSRRTALPCGKRDSSGSNSNSAGKGLRRRNLLRGRGPARNIQSQKAVAADDQLAVSADDEEGDNIIEKRSPHHRHRHPHYHHRGENSHHSGQGTYYHTSGKGACGKRDSNSEHVGAVSSDIFKMSLCGKKARVCHKTKCVIVVIEDECPTCDKTSVDMTEVAFEDIAKKQEGEVEIKWQMLD